MASVKLLFFISQLCNISQDYSLRTAYAVAPHNPLILSPPATNPQTPIHPIFQPGTPPVTPLKCNAIGNHAPAITASIHHLLSSLSSISRIPATAFSSYDLAALFAFKFCASRANLKKSHDTPASQKRYAIAYKRAVPSPTFLALVDRFIVAMNDCGTTP
ncbi:hypothetical protein GRF29_28g2144453 [Pseudopithomyces chartarum]|uniref:Uncharacterized protein n=1 Tax=Pseudopithomyces chartarum TaxID=1892770 RepID=A0AAN6RJL2_9PLEO|nr:hypothetical protein GRF29_28g2144453 [Pseudopithomyces chartarum]